MPNDVTLNINFQLQSSAQFSKQDAERPILMAVENVAFNAAKNRQRRLKANVQRDFAPIVERELQNMARDVSRMVVGISNPNNPPPGELRITGKISQAMIGNSGPMSIASMTGQWALRSKAYMKQKVKKYRTRRWFKNTGRLQDQLKSVGTYRAAYGPIRVAFIPTNISAGSVGKLSTLGRSSGGQSSNIMIGRLEVSPLRRLSASDLPGIGQKANWKSSLMSPLAKSVRVKLEGQSKTKYRPVIEPFLSYYMQRKIPNSVFLKLEQSLA